MDKKEIKKVVLAYSGGLDTSIIIPWLKENYNDPEIIAVAGNVGQADELEGLEEKALKTGASKLIIADLIDEMVDEVVIPALKMGASYEGYLLGTAFARLSGDDGEDTLVERLQEELQALKAKYPSGKFTFKERDVYFDKECERYMLKDAE